MKHLKTVTALLSMTNRQEYNILNSRSTIYN